MVLLTIDHWSSLVCHFWYCANSSFIVETTVKWTWWRSKTGSRKVRILYLANNNYMSKESNCRCDNRQNVPWVWSVSTANFTPSAIMDSARFLKTFPSCLTALAIRLMQRCYALSLAKNSKKEGLKIWKSRYLICTLS